MSVPQHRPHLENCRRRRRRYYNDVWSFDLAELKWTPLGPKAGHAAPEPRGGCQLALHGDTLFIFGGYSVKKVEQDKGGRIAAAAAAVGCACCAPCVRICPASCGLATLLVDDGRTPAHVW